MFGSDLAPALMVVGRVLLGVLFVAGGIRHLTIFAEIGQVMQKRGVPFPRLILGAGTAFQIAAGALLMLGILVVPAVLGLTIFTIAASVMMLNFWDMEGEPRAAAFNNWLSNIGIIGGLFVAAAQSLL